MATKVAQTAAAPGEATLKILNALQRGHKTAEDLQHFLGKAAKLSNLRTRLSVMKSKGLVIETGRDGDTREIFWGITAKGENTVQKALGSKGTPSKSSKPAKPQSLRRKDTGEARGKPVKPKAKPKPAPEPSKPKDLRRKEDAKPTEETKPPAEDKIGRQTAYSVSSAVRSASTEEARMRFRQRLVEVTVDLIQRGRLSIEITLPEDLQSVLGDEGHRITTMSQPLSKALEGLPAALRDAIVGEVTRTAGEILVIKLDLKGQKK